MTKKLIQKIDDEICGLFSLWKIAPIQKISTWAVAKFLRAKCSSKEAINNLVQSSKKVAKEIGMPWQKVFLSQYIYDFSQAANGLFPSACTVGVTKTKDNKTAFIRCMDWQVPDGIGSFTQATDTTDGQKVTGFPGFLGTVTAIGNGLAFAMNQAPSNGIYINGIPTCYFAELLRQKIADLANDSGLRFACEMWAGMIEGSMEFRPMSPCLFLFADEKEYCVMEIVPDLFPGGKDRAVALKFGKVKDGVALSNHYITEEHSGRNPKVFEWQDERGKIWSNDTLERAESMKKLLKLAKAKTSRGLQTITKVMGEPVINQLTANLTVGTTDLSSFDVYWK